MNKIRSLFPILFLLSGMMILWSQVVPDGKTISSISIELEGPDTIGKSFILQNLQIETGIPYKSNAIDKSITNLMGTGAIDDVKVFLDPKNSSGPDDVHSITKDQFKELIELVRYSEKILGDGEKKPSKSEKKNLLTNRVSIVTIKEISKGDKISISNIDIKRPGTGLAPKYFDKILGKKARRNISREQPLTWNDVE